MSPMPRWPLIEKLDKDCVREVETLEDVRTRPLEEGSTSIAVDVRDSTARPRPDLHVGPRYSYQQA